MLEVDGKVLIESLAIENYLAATHGILFLIDYVYLQWPACV